MYCNMHITNAYNSLSDRVIDVQGTSTLYIDEIKTVKVLFNVTKKYWWCSVNCVKRQTVCAYLREIICETRLDFLMSLICSYCNTAFLLPPGLYNFHASLGNRVSFVLLIWRHDPVITNPTSHRVNTQFFSNDVIVGYITMITSFNGSWKPHMCHFLQNKIFYKISWLYNRGRPNKSVIQLRRIYSHSARYVKMRQN